MQFYHFTDEHRGVFNLFHKFILAFFFLIFLTACGYKNDPLYQVKDEKGEVKSVKQYEKIEKW